MTIVERAVCKILGAFIGMIIVGGFSGDLWYGIKTGIKFLFWDQNKEW